jgi:molybdopterin adenylyltransferase
MLVRCAILTISDRSSRGERPDASGPVIADMVKQAGWDVVLQDIVPDERDAISATLSRWSDLALADIILTTGGTGFAPRDVTPEATLQVIERDAPGIAEGMRAESLKKTPHAMLSRGKAGIRGKTIIINLPGSPKAVAENLAYVIPVLPHAVELLTEGSNSEAGHSFHGGN